MKPSKHGPIPCPSCGGTIENAMCLLPDGPGNRPVLGDLTVCPHCATILEFSGSGPYLHIRLRLDVYPKKRLLNCTAEIRRELMVAQRAVLKVKA